MTLAQLAGRPAVRTRLTSVGVIANYPDGSDEPDLSLLERDAAVYSADGSPQGTLPELAVAASRSQNMIARAEEMIPSEAEGVLTVDFDLPGGTYATDSRGVKHAITGIRVTAACRRLT